MTKGSGEAPKKRKKKRKPQGGCPFMPTENKKPPALERYDSAYEIPYISNLRHLFNFRGIFSRGDEDEGPKTHLDDSLFS